MEDFFQCKPQNILYTECVEVGKTICIDGAFIVSTPKSAQGHHATLGMNEKACKYHLSLQTVHFFLAN